MGTWNIGNTKEQRGHLDTWNIKDSKDIKTTGIIGDSRGHQGHLVTWDTSSGTTRTPGTQENMKDTGRAGFQETTGTLGKMEYLRGTEESGRGWRTFETPRIPAD